MLGAGWTIHEYLTHEAVGLMDDRISIPVSLFTNPSGVFLGSSPRKILRGRFSFEMDQNWDVGKGYSYHGCQNLT